MRRFFVKNLLFTIIVNVLVMPAWVLLIDRTVQNVVGAKEYGAYASLYSLAFIFSITLDLGITNYNTRHIAQNPGELKTLFPAMFSARLVLMLVYGAVLAIIGITFHYSAWEMQLLFGIFLIHSLLTMLQFIRSNVAALQKFKVDSVLSVSGRLLMIAICGVLLVYKPLAAHFKIEWFIITQVVCYFITALIAFYVLNRIHPVSIKFSFHGRTLLKIIKDTLPYAILIFLMSVYTRADMWLVKQLLPGNGQEQAGIYASAYRYLDVGNMFGLMFAGILLPLFGRMLSQKQDVQPIVKMTVNILLPVALMVACAACFFGDEIMNALYKKTDADSGTIFALVMCSFPAFCMMYVYSTLLTANGSLRILNRIALAGVVINLGINFYMIPHYNALGAALTGLITQLFVSACYIIFASRVVKLPFNMKWILSHVAYLALIILAGYAVLVFFHSGWILQLLIFGLACIIAMFVFRFISIKAVMQLLESRNRS
jgi:O-antigen/teichoic acid export membrane protein